MKKYARVCQNGHVLGTHSQPDRSWTLSSPPYCPDCGSEAFKHCQKCEKAFIPVEDKNVSREFDVRDLPKYCPGCGEDFPWIEPVEKEEIRDGKFIEISKEEIAGGFYVQLTNEINQCYKVGANNATYILYRKLIENLIYDSLRAYTDPAEEMDLYFDKENNIRRRFDVLVDSLKIKSDELSQYSGAIDSEFIKSVRDFQDKGNSAAHTVENLVKDDAIESQSDEATYLARTLFQLRENIHAQGKASN